MMPVQKGDRSFHQLATIDGDRFSIDLADTEKVHLLRDILDQLNLGEMPPQKKDVQLPKSCGNQEYNCLADVNPSNTRGGESTSVLFYAASIVTNTTTLSVISRSWYFAF